MKQTIINSPFFAILNLSVILEDSAKHYPDKTAYIFMAPGGFEIIVPVTVL